MYGKFVSVIMMIALLRVVNLVQTRTYVLPVIFYVVCRVFNFTFSVSATI